MHREGGDPDLVSVYDTTLRDGSQGEGISFSRDDKLRIVSILDAFKVDYIEGGWPGSNPKDIEFFKAARDLKLGHAKLAAFGSTRHHQKKAGDDPNLRALLAVETPVVTIFGKSWKLHVDLLGTTPEHNLAMIEESVRFLKDAGREVIYDAEHFFDGHADDPEYALATLEAARRGGADCLVLCDTNGGSMVHLLGEVVSAVKARLPETPVGIHTHNDGGLAVANSLEALRRGAVHVQGTINGLGERCGNADLCIVIPNLLLKMNRKMAGIDREGLRKLTPTARYVSAVANQNFSENHPFIGQMAFAHKGGVHVNSVMKASRSYEHVEPDQVGNSRRILISELSGKSNLEFLAAQQGIDLKEDPTAARKAVEEIKRLENLGYVFEGAEASSILILLRAMGKIETFFELENYRTIVQHLAGKDGGRTISEATVKIRVCKEEHLAVGEGVGPVDALDAALRGAIRPFYPEVEGVRLTDYKVRVIDTGSGTSAKVRVLIESADAANAMTWGTVGTGANIIEATWEALRDSIIYGIYRSRTRK